MRVLMLVCAVFASGAGTPPAFAQQQRVLVQAICMDARNSPHPAAQTFGGQDVAPDYLGEIYRCMAGTWLRYTVDGAVLRCDASQALWHEHGALSCRTQIEQQREHDRALLREFGPGDKLVHVAQQPPRPRQRPRWRY